MNPRVEKHKAQANFTRYRGQPGGHYESYFLRANHPQKKEAFWIRYTIYSPRHAPEKALGELWAIWFDGHTGKHVAIKQEFPINRSEYHAYHFSLDFNGALLNDHEARGSIDAGGKTISWELHYKGNEETLFLFPLSAYELPWPKAKSLVPKPLASFSGHIEVNGTKHIVDGWIGSQNHNWGERHTDEYAWGQVAGFDNAPDSFLEVGSGKINLPFGIKTPYLTPLVLRHRGHEYALNNWHEIVLARAELNGFMWRFSTENSEVKIEGKIEAKVDDFVGLTYYNPPGGVKYCLNSKIASCYLKLTEKGRLGLSHELYTKHRAAFEILTDNPNHGVKMYI
ncbi:MAG: hypothetical protein NZM25_01345 [Leptospiraceae bacterium]|nr:hypothetical protein [Leptospiraceae bacterium]MDW8306370.1 hypothetical protein [Leptospiraceae bacterium]